ncbi:MAG TPA: hypothetical protein VHL77_03555 [Ferruginibacter sp.]|jgi:hypothetical protein|nr:hypothetical protein [Ferruginibacter sp.]
MKKLLAVVIIISFIACNGNKRGSSETEDKNNTTSIKHPAPGCGKLVLFKKGAIIESTSYDAAGNETSKTTTTVSDVKNEGGILTATSSGSMKSAAVGDKSLNLIYKCDGDNLYMDINSMMQNFEGLNHVKGDIKPLQFPINISVGQKLPDASYTVAIDKGIKMDVTTTYKNRTVAAIEQVTTKGGSWPCYKVTTDIDSDVQGLDDNTKKMMEAAKAKLKMSMTMWFNPEMGIVKMEMYHSGTVNIRTEVTSVQY